MKKVIAFLCMSMMVLSLVACGKVKAVDASTEDKTAVMEAAKSCLNSEAFLGYVEAYENSTGETAKKPKITVAFTLQCDVEGYALDLILFEAEAMYLIEEENAIFDRIQFVVDNKTGKIYDSASYCQQMANFNGVIDSEEAAIVCLMNIDFKTNGYLWSETEVSTKFTGADLKEINGALN